LRFFIKRYKQLSVLFPVLVALTGSAQSTLTVTVTGFRDPKGQLLYSLFNRADGFPDQPGKAFRIGAVPVTGAPASFTIGSLPAGEYALSLIHDSNGNGQLDKNSMGIPVESIGFSNNVLGAFGPPKFQRARFQLQTGKQELPIRLRMGQ